MAYNQKFETATTTCINPGLSYCEEWTETKEITFHYFDLLYLIFKLLLAGLIIWAFLYKRKK